MTLNEKLLKIQQELKVPKTKLNKFGGYKYRTVDMIVEQVKPLTDKYNCVLTLDDKLMQIGDRYYVCAVARLDDIETTEFRCTTAYAREQLERKKSDESQLTGAASTYARKYALNGLFLLDDTADPDSYAGEPESVDDDPEELDRQEAEEQEEKPAKRRIRSPRKKKEESIEDYMNVPETPDGSEASISVAAARNASGSYWSYRNTRVTTLRLATDSPPRRKPSCIFSQYSPFENAGRRQAIMYAFLVASTEAYRLGLY